MNKNRFILLAVSSFLIQSCFAFDSMPTGVTILTRNDFIGRHLFTVGEALEGLTSVNLDKIGYKGSNITTKLRGVPDANQVQVLLNGRSLSHEFDGRVDLSQLPLSMVEEIHISRGGGPFSMTAEATGGTINIITSYPENEGLVTEIGTGVGRDGVTYSDGRLRGRSYWGDLSLFGGLRRSSGYMLNEEHTNNHTLGKITRSFNGKGYWGVEYFSQESEVGLSNGTPVPLTEWNRKLERSPNTPNRLREERFQYAKGILASPEMGGGVFYADFIWSRRGEINRIAPNQFALSDKDYGVNHYKARYKRNALEIGVQREDKKRTVFPFSSNKTIQSSYYLTEHWEGKLWLVSPSIRYDDHSEWDGVFSPRLVAAFNPLRQWILSGSVTKGFRAPNFDELFIGREAIQPNQQLDPEVSWMSDIGLKAPFGSAGLVQLTGFFIRSRDLIQPDSSSKSFVNRGKQRVKGAEAEIHIEFGQTTTWRHFEWIGNYTHQNSKRNMQNSLGFVQTALTPRTLSHIQLVHHLPNRITLTHEWRYQSEQYQLDNKGGIKIPGYYQWDFRFNIKVLKSELYFEVMNITQRRFADTLAIYTPDNGGGQTAALAPQPDRSYFTGLTIRFDN